tara:strand:- start:2357 stop:2737 length:381 start_codon:yes stop_codon:yes gene_type:complete
VKNIVAIAFVSIVLCPIFINTGVFSYYSIDIKSFTEKYCSNKSEPELRCNGKCKLNSIIVSTDVPSSKDKKSKSSSLKIPLFLAEKFSFDFRKEQAKGIITQFHSAYCLFKNPFLEINTPPPQEAL